MFEDVDHSLAELPRSSKSLEQRCQLSLLCEVSRAGTGGNYRR